MPCLVFSSRFSSSPLAHECRRRHSCAKGDEENHEEKTRQGIEKKHTYIGSRETSTHRARSKLFVPGINSLNHIDISMPVQFQPSLAQDPLHPPTRVPT